MKFPVDAGFDFIQNGNRCSWQSKIESLLRAWKKGVNGMLFLPNLVKKAEKGEVNLKQVPPGFDGRRTEYANSRSIKEPPSTETLKVQIDSPDQYGKKDKIHREKFLGT